jgi:hypothetical protein
MCKIYCFERNHFVLGKTILAGMKYFIGEIFHFRTKRFAKILTVLKFKIFCNTTNVLGTYKIHIILGEKRYLVQRPRSALFTALIRIRIRGSNFV